MSSVAHDGRDLLWDRWMEPELHFTYHTVMVFANAVWFAIPSTVFSYNNCTNKKTLKYHPTNLVLNMNLSRHFYYPPERCAYWKGTVSSLTWLNLISVFPSRHSLSLEKYIYKEFTSTDIWRHRELLTKFPDNTKLWGDPSTL